MAQGADPNDGGAYDMLSVLGVVAEVIDNDAANVLVAESMNDTMVAEDPSVIADDTYAVVLTRAPSGDVIIDISVTDGDVVTSVDTLTFTAGNWHIPQEVTVTAGIDDDVEGIHFSRIPSRDHQQPG